ncbi:MAG TPA: phosphoribosyltransferase family protein [Syntrophales bacterium]|nr:phosphoribosyltransferase family protein [Syntrophales bacterium]
MGKLKIVSRSAEPFRDRREAGALLGRELHHLKGKNPLVLGIPRGGIVVARELARLLEGELDLVISRKIGAPGNPELAIGAVGEDGRVFLHGWMLSSAGADAGYLEKEKERQIQEIRRRNACYREAYPRIDPKDRVVVLTDDGIATGATFQAAIWSVKNERPAVLIAAVPVAPQNALGEIQEDADEVICLKLPHYFTTVGQFYDRFEQIDDEEVIEILRQETARREFLPKPGKDREEAGSRPGK